MSKRSRSKIPAIENLVRFGELLESKGTVGQVELVTTFEDEEQRKDALEKLADLGESLKDVDLSLAVKTSPHLHDRVIRLDNGWEVKIGRGLDVY